MRSWLSNWRNRRELDVEAELRAARPEASARFVKSIAARVNPRPVKPVRTRTRLGLAAAVTATMVAVVGATGGFSSAASSILGATHSVTHFTTPSAKPPTPPTTSPGAGARPTSAGAQYGAAPTISSVAPNPAYAGASITVQGTNFSGINQISEVDLGTEATSFVVNSGTSLSFTVPADGATGTVKVINSTGNATSGSPLVIVGAPTITHVNTGGEADTHEGGVGSAVQIQGTNFQTTTTVTLNGKGVTFNANGAGTEIDFTIPSTVPTGNKGGIVVTNPAGTASDSSYNVLSNGPKLTAFAPALGRPHEHVILSGTNLQADTAPNTHVLFSDGSGGTVDAGTVTFASGGKLDVQVPTNAETGVLTVSNTIGSSTSAKSYTVVTDATVSSISPNFGKPNDMITITGSSFTPAVGQTTDAVQFTGSAAAVAVKPMGDNKLIVKVPSDAATGPITVDNGSGTAGSSATWYRLAQQTGTASPSDAASGAAVEVTGTHLIGTKTVAVNGKAVTAFTTPDDNHLDFVLPVGTPTTAPAAKAGIVITNAGPFTLQISSFVVDSTAPTIKTVSAHGATAALSAAAPGDQIDITGTFLNAALDVYFGYPDGSSSGHVQVGSGSSPTNAVTTVTVTVPADARTGVITIDNGSGAVSSAKPLTILGTPVVLGFSPGYGVSGTKITIVGTNFAGASTVDFVADPPGTTQSAKATVNKDGSISVTAPKNIASSTKLRVNVPDPAGSTLHGDSGNNYFVVVSKPTIAASPFSDAGGKAGHQVTVTGTNFQGVTSVSFGKVQAGFQPVGTSTTQLLVTIPSGANSSTITIANAAGSVTSTAVYSILRVSSIAPSKGKVNSTVTIMGTGFNGGGHLASVKFGATSATVNVAKSNDTKLTVTVPVSLAPGTYTVTVHGDFGDVTTSFQVTP